MPWSRQHCGQLAYAVLHDVLGFDVREHDLWIDTDAPNLEGRIDEYLEQQGERWLRVGDTAIDATQIGDVIWSKGTTEFGCNHLSVVVDLKPVPTVISTARASGAFLQRASATARVRGVYRFIG